MQLTFPFPQTFCINLDSSLDRWKHIQDQFIGWTTPVERFSAIRASPGWIGCALSHLQCIKKASNQNLPWVLILEDDCVLREDSKKRFLDILSFLWDNKESWDIFLGGVTQIQDAHITCRDATLHLAEVKGLSTHFTLVNSSIFSALPDIFDKVKSQGYPFACIDNVYRDNFRLWTVFPFLALQRPGLSLIENIKVDYTDMFSVAESKVKEAFYSKEVLKAYVINLPHRTDRWQKMQQNWMGIVDTLVRVDGVKSLKRFQGCALAHISAIRTAWNAQEQEGSLGKIVLVLEDDSVPQEGLTRSKLLDILTEARNASAEFDALYLSPLIDSSLLDHTSIKDLDEVLSKTSTRFFRASPTQLLICCAMMVYSKRVLNWLDEYEAHVNDINAQETIPNDRILSSDSWKSLNEQRIYNRPEVWVTSHQVAYVGDSKSDNGGESRISKSIVFKRTPALLKDLAERAKPISNEFRTPKPLRITLLENWHGGKLSIDASFTLHSAFLTDAAGIRERIDDRLKMLLGDSSHRYGYGYKYFADGVLEFNAWIGKHAYQIEVPQGNALYWEHALRDDADGAIAVPAVPTEAATDFTYRYRDDSAFGIVAANVSSSDLHFLGDFSYARRFRVFQCNTRAYLLHIIENYEDLDEVTAFVIGDASDYPVSARSFQDEIMALFHEAFAHGYAELSTLGPFRPEEVPELPKVVSTPKKVDIAIQLSHMSKDAFCKVLGLKAQWYTMPPIFAVRKDHILRRPKQFYQRAFDSIPSNTEFSEEQEWMDSLWRSVFVEQPDAEFSKHVHVATVLAADIGGESIQERKDATSEAKVRFAHARANADPKARSTFDLSHLGAANETIQIKWSYLGRCHYSNAALSETNALFS